MSFKIPRIKWAQSASEIFIKRLSSDKIKRLSDKPISVVEYYLKETGKGLYLVGLDCHVGFIVVREDEILFVHANYTIIL